MSDSGIETATDERRGRSPAGMILALVAAALGGLFVVGVASALEPSGSDECTSYDGCIDYEDATATVDPATDLVDRQTVSVTGQDFDPRLAQAAIVQCDAALVEASQADGCDLSRINSTTVGADGSISAEVTVRRIIATAVGGEVDCAAPGACVIGVGTYEANPTIEVLEGVAVPIAFDPAVPPVPPLEIEVTIEDASAEELRVTVTCNRDASFDADFDLQQRERPRTASADGYAYGECTTTPTEVVVPLYPGERLVRGGPATLNVRAYAGDGFESAFVETTEEVRLTGGPRPEAPPPADEPGRFTSIEVLETLGANGDVGVLVEVDCSRPATYGEVFVELTQWAGIEQVRGSGWVWLGECDGVQTVEVPVSAYNGVLAGGPVHVRASVTVWDEYVPGEPYFSDWASTSTTAKLKGTVRPVDPDVTPNPDSRITIGEVGRDEVNITVDCEEPVVVDVYASGTQTQARWTTFVSGQAFGVDCDGVTPVAIDIAQFDDGLRTGTASISVSAWAYRPLDGGDFPVNEYAWDDWQQASVRVRPAAS